MFPIHIVGIALAGRMLFSKQNGKSEDKKQNFPIRLRLPVRPNDSVDSSPANPLEILVKGINRQLTDIIKPQPRENFDEIVEKFIPQGSVVLTPKYPSHSKSIGFADLDGDLRNELIVSFRNANEIKTIILKKDNDTWYKAAEAGNEGYESINYREFVDLTGEGKKQMIIAFTSKGKAAELHGYSLGENNLSELFRLNYNRLQVLKAPGNNRNKPEVSLAIWNKEDSGAYNVELLKWNGAQLESINDAGTYYSDNVVPYCLRQVKRDPDIPQNWYNLANSLAKAGVLRDAQMAIEVGMRYNLSPELSDKFAALKDRIEKT
ncbi:MAG: hypothetical protein BWY74_02843 [Firmicutes bacterium ADurb.Bin419]|nr:MAG: hypothetical protein BWY74_02843 [Firmicutes bacterium ADurb.Bin419]